VFLGHFAAGLAARRAEPALPLGIALVAAQLPDAVWPALVLAGVERVAIAPGDTVVTPLRFESYPWSHSLLAVGVWAALFGGLVWWRSRHARAAWLASALVLSHWLLDFASHRADLPLHPWGGPRFGLGLWNSLPATLAVEGLLFAAGIALYAGAERRRRGRGLAVFAATLATIYALNVFGPPPPNLTAIGVAGLMAVPIVYLWGRWLDRA
jgi:hypothetical protein